MTASNNSGDSLETAVSVHWAALLAAMMFPTLTTVAYFVFLSGSPAMQTVYGGSKIVQFAFPILWVWAVQRRKIRLTRPDARSLIWGFAFGAAAMAAGFAAYYGYFKTSPALADAPRLIGAKVHDMGLTRPALFIAFAAFLSVPHSLLEEYYWRWFCFGQMRRVTPVSVAIVVSSLAFMSHHVIVIHAFLPSSWAATWLFSLCVAFGGGIWAWLYNRYGSLWGSWLSHFMIDCGVMYIGYDLVAW